MESFQFIPTSQKNIDQIAQKKSYNIDSRVIVWLIFLFIVYVVTIGVVYWFVIVNERAKLRQSIDMIDVENYSYYPEGDLEQELYNFNDLIVNVYNPMPVIRSIESSYIANSRVENFVYSKTDKSISFTMIVSSIADATLQVQKFKDIKELANSSVDFSDSTTVPDSSDISFDVRIKLN